MDFRNYVFLVGAGISVDAPSGIPTTVEIIEEICKWISDSTKTKNKLISKIRPGNSFNPYDFIRFESIIEKISLIEPYIFNYLKNLEVVGYPNAYHFFLAYVISNAGYVVTTNFDNRIELAFEILGLKSNCVVLNKKSMLTNESNFIKIHGSFPYGKRRYLKPKAGLRQIGNIGFCYDYLPKFKKWFSNITFGKTLIVMGYSASDSFDVVPLFEEHCKASIVEWFDYKPSISELEKREIFKKDENIIPLKKSTEFVEVSLERFNFYSPNSKSYLISGPNLEDYLIQKFQKDFKSAVQLSNKIVTDKPDSKDYKKQNLEFFRSILKENALEDQEKKIIIDGILREGAFGESFTIGYGYSYESVTMGPLFKKVHLAFLENDIDSSRKILEQNENKCHVNPDEYLDYLEASAYLDIESGRIKDGYDKLREAINIDGDPILNSEILLLLDESEFCKYQEKKDINSIKKVSLRTKNNAKKGAIIWGYVLYHWMKAFELEIKLYDNRRKHRLNKMLIDEIIHHSKRVIYYGIRCARQDLYSDAVRLLAKIKLDFYTEDIYQLLERLLIWIDYCDSEEYGVTLCNLLTVAIYEKNFQLITKYLRKIESIPSSQWKNKAVFLNIAKAEFEEFKENYQESLYYLELAENELIKLNDGDPWSQHQPIKNMRNKIQNILVKRHITYAST